VCDQIADNILDAYLNIDKESRVACEVTVSKNNILVMGEITSNAKVDIESIVRKTVIDIGYDNDGLGFNGNTCKINIDISKQSSDIAMGVNKDDIGAGDQGIMYGYATNETDNYMPLVHNIACNLTKRLDFVRKNNIIEGLRPDGKAQVTLQYDNDKVRVHTVVVSIQHEENKDLDLLKDEIINEVINKVIDNDLIDNRTNILINPTGRFVIGGPLGDSGLTGRKIMVDSYGGIAKHGGGAFSGKDYTKVDRSAAYYARYVAKNLVANNLCDKCEVSVSYAIGISHPISVSIDTFGTNKVSEEKILNIISKNFDFSPRNIIKELDLKNIKYKETTMYSHFGKDNLSWENIINI